jgi:hypothetical protein
LLFRSGCPTAVSFAVVTINVNSVDAAVMRGDPHIFQEVLEVVPSLIIADAPASIVVPLLEIGVRASLLHPFPYPICPLGFLANRVVRTPCRTAMLGKSLFGSLA